MAQAAQWHGSPHVKGSTEAMRMVLLTFSLIGLQYVSTSRLQASMNVNCQVHLGHRDDILHSISLTTRPNQKQIIASMDSRSSLRAHNAAHCRHNGRQKHVQVGSSTTSHDRRHSHCEHLSIDTGLDQRDCGRVRRGIRAGRFPLHIDPYYETSFDNLQRREATISLAVLSIYALDFAINAVQSSCRSLIVDTLPIPKQQSGSAWGMYSLRTS